MRSRLLAGIALRLGVAAAIIAMGAAAALAAPGAAHRSQAPRSSTISVVASWTGTEEYDFKKMIAEATKGTGITVSYTGTRALPQLIAADIQRGNPPDVAILPSPGTLLQYQRQGYLRPLSQDVVTTLTSEYDPQWQTIMKLGTETFYTLPVKVGLQSLVWYDPKRLAPGTSPGRSAPTTWAQLTSLEEQAKQHGSAPWCVGLDSTPVPGWPGTDWIGNILLHLDGTEVYEKWADGTLPWTSPLVRSAWEDWGRLVTGPGQVYGGSQTALVSQWDWENAQSSAEGGNHGTDPMFDSAGGCYFQAAASPIDLAYQQDFKEQPGNDYDYFMFPAQGLPGQTSQNENTAWEVAADLLAVFHDTPAVRQFTRNLASEQAQSVWPGIPGGGAASANEEVLRAYPGLYGKDTVSESIAHTLTDPKATLCFNASDDMPVTLQNAFYQGVMEYLENPAPSHLTEILDRLDQVRQSAYAAFPARTARFSCGVPRTAAASSAP